MEKFYLFQQRDHKVWSEKRTALKPSTTLCYTVQCTNNPKQYRYTTFFALHLSFFFFETPYILCGK